MSPESDTDFGVDRRPRPRLTMSMPVHGGNKLRFHCGRGWIFPTIDRQEPSGTDSRQGAILLIQKSKSAMAEDPPFISTFMGFGC